MIKINPAPQYDYNQVLIRPKPSDLTSRSEVNLKRTITFKHSNIKWVGVPIIAANMDSTGTFNIYEVLSNHTIITAMNKFYTKADYIKYMTSDSTESVDVPSTNFGSIASSPRLDPDLFMVSTGISESNLEQLQDILSVIDCNWICIDIANGYIKPMVDFCRRVRNLYPDKIIVGGNVATQEMVEELILNGGVDVVKVGIGPGSACSTRLKTGVGVPQLSAVMECADAAHAMNGHIIADGGITCPGDVAKALGGGADFVMIGGQLAGHKENPGTTVTIDGKLFKSFYGMSSEKAQKTHYGKMDKYRASEGRELMVPYKGELNDTVGDYLGGLRSTCTYIGAKNIKDMPKCTTFGLTTQQINTHFS